MGSIGRPVAILAKEIIAGKVENVFRSFGFQSIVGLPQGGMVAVMMLFASRYYPGVGIAAIFDEKDRCLWMNVPELFDERYGALPDLFWSKVWVAVDDVNSGVNPGK